MYLIDTNVIVYAYLGKDADSRFLRNAIENHLGNISVIVAGEFLTKAPKKQERTFKKLLSIFPILDIDLTVAESAAKYRKRYLKTSRSKMLDNMLAAQAKINKLTLVTHNKKDFPMKDIKIVSPEEIV